MFQPMLVLYLQRNITFYLVSLFNNQIHFYRTKLVLERPKNKQKTVFGNSWTFSLPNGRSWRQKQWVARVQGQYLSGRIFSVDYVIEAHSSFFGEKIPARNFNRWCTRLAWSQNHRKPIPIFFLFLVPSLKGITLCWFMSLKSTDEKSSEVSTETLFVTWQAWGGFIRGI